MAELIILDDNTGSPVKTEVKKKTGLDVFNEIALSFQKMDVKEKAIFFRLIAVMLDSGMTLIKSITTLERQEKDKKLKKMYSTFVEMLKEGKTFSDCLEAYPANFGESEIGMVRSGEKTGKLNDTLISISDQVEKLSSIIGKLKSALTYPVVILIVVIGVVVIMMTVVVPKLIVIFEDKSALPTSTQILIGMSDFMINHGLKLLFGIVVFTIIFMMWKRTKSGTMIVDMLKLKIPKFGEVYKKYILSKFSRVFSNLVASGVSIVESLRIVSGSVGNEIYRQRILLLVEDVKSGIKIWESIDGDELFPDMMVQMIQVGEQTATLDKTIIKVADFYDEQFDNVVSTMNKLLEPIIIVVLAIMVGFLAIAIMQPILGLADQITAG